MTVNGNRRHIYSTSLNLEQRAHFIHIYRLIYDDLVTFWQQNKESPKVFCFLTFLAFSLGFCRDPAVAHSMSPCRNWTLSVLFRFHHHFPLVLLVLVHEEKA